MSQKFLNPVEVNGQVSAEYLDLSTSTSHSVNAGEIAWNSVDGTFDIGLLNGVTLQAGQEMHFYGKATEAISNGNAVMFAGVQGDHILIAKADAVTINANPEYFMGVATQDFATNDFGYVTAFGNVRGIDTSTYTLGDILYYDSTTSTDGLLTPTIPSAPKAKIIVAAVVRVHATQGILAVRPHTMPRLKDIQDINVDTATTGEILQLQSDGVWENKTLSEAGIVSGTGTTNYVSKFTSATTLGNSQIFDNGTNVLIGVNVNETSHKLQIRTTGSSNLLSLYNATALGGAKISFYDNSSNAAVGTLGGALIFYANTRDTERMRITSTGNVGIGTTTPDTLLHISSLNSSILRLESTNTALGLNAVVGEIQFESNDASSTGTGVKAKIGAYSDVSAGNAVGLRFFTGDAGFATGTEKMRILAGGNVGIGTTSPGARLDVRAQGALSTDIAFRVRNSADTANLIEVNGAGGVDIRCTPSNRLTLSNTVETNFDIVDTGGHSKRFFVRNSDKTLAIYNNDTGQQRTQFRLVTGTGASNDKLSLLEAGGNVGIGTTSPGSKLTIVSSDNTVLKLKGGISNNQGSAFYIERANSTSTLFAIGDSSSITGGTPDSLSTVFSAVPLNFYINGSERMRITSTGNVGIGTTAPLTAGGAAKWLTLNGNIGTYSGGHIYAIGDVAKFYHYVDSDGLFAHQAASGIGQKFIANASEVMRITSAGNVGIGTTSPVYKFHVNDTSDGVVGHFSGGVSNYTLISFKSNEPNVYSTSLGSFNSGMLFRTGATDRMYITSSGNVGIGTSSPNALLDVEGDALINRITVGRGGGNISTNTAIGRAVLDSNVSGERNTVFGYSSLNALDRSGNTVVGCNINLMPNGVDLIDSDNNLVVGQYNPDFSDNQVPHIYAPDRIFCPQGTDTALLEIDYSLYTAAFLEYSIYNAGGDQFRAGRFVVAFKATGTPVYTDYPEVIFSGTTSNVVFDVAFGAGLPVIKLLNNESSDFYIRFTSRLLMR